MYSELLRIPRAQGPGVRGSDRLSGLFSLIRVLVLSTLCAPDSGENPRAARFTVHDPDMTFRDRRGDGVRCNYQPLRREAAWTRIGSARRA